MLSSFNHISGIFELVLKIFFSGDTTCKGIDFKTKAINRDQIILYRDIGEHLYL